MVVPHDGLKWFRQALKVAHFVVSSLAMKGGNIHKFSNSIVFNQLVEVRGAKEHRRCLFLVL